MNDPFAFGDPNTPGAAGQTQGFWRDLATFGGNLAAAANARTAGGFLANGPNFAGPLGAAISQTMGQGNINAQLRSELLQRASATQALQLQNQITAAGLPAAMARARLQAQIYSSPQSLNDWINGGSGNGGAPAPSSTPAAPTSGGAPTPTPQQPSQGGYTDAVLKLEGVGNNPFTTAAGYGQFTAPMWQKFAAANPQMFQGMTPDQVLAARNDPKFGAAATHWLGVQNSATLTNLGVQPTGQSLALAHFVGPQAAASIMKADPGLPAATAISQAIGPQEAQVYVQKNPNLAAVTVGGLRNRYAGVPNLSQAPMQAAAAGGNPSMLPGGLDPQTALARADALTQQAIRLQMAGFDAAPTQQQAQQLRQYALQYDLNQSEPRSIRGEGGAIVTPNGVIQSPVVRTVLGPDHREWLITQNTVETGEPYQRPSGVPSWAPPGTLTAVPQALAPGEKSAEEDAAADAFGEKSRAQYASSLGTIRSMADLNQEFDHLNANGPGWYNTGAGAAWKLEFAKSINAMAASAGIKPIFDPDKVASGEDILKQSKLAGMQTLASLFGGNREAASIIQSTQAAVPNIENTPMGAKLVLNGVLEAARWQADQHTFMSNWYFDHKGNMVGADVAFNQQYPAQAYTRRAISQVRPYQVSGQKDFARFLPGTLVTLKGGDPSNIKVVPGNSTISWAGQGTQANATP